MISILIPVYNAERYLDACLDSCYNQSYSDIEIIAVNDGSTDSSGEILNVWAQKDSRIKIVDKVNEGLVLARRSGIEAAIGEFIFFLDSDDTIEHNAIELLSKKQLRTQADVTIGVIVTKTSTGKVLATWPSQCNANDSTEQLLAGLLQGAIMPSLCGRLIRKTVIEKIEIEPHITIGEDFIITLQISCIDGIRFESITQRAYNYIQHPGSMINTYTRSNANKRMLYIQWVDNFLNNISITTPEIELGKARFFLDEYYAFLRNRGLPSQSGEIAARINTYYLNNRKFVAQVPFWRTLLLKLYRFNYTTGRLAMLCFLMGRNLFRF